MEKSKITVTYVLVGLKAMIKKYAEILIEKLENIDQWNEDDCKVFREAVDNLCEYLKCKNEPTHRRENNYN